MTIYRKAMIYIGLMFLPLLAFSAPKEKAPADAISDCMVISVPGAYTLSGDLPGSSGYLSDGSCLVIEAGPVSIDLDGHTITGLGSGYGITDNGVPYQNTRISNGNISGFVTGIDLATSLRSAVENIHVTDNMQDGIVVGGASKMFRNIASGNNRGLVIQCPGNALGNSAWGNAEYDLFKIDPNLCLLTEGLNSLGTSGDNCATCEAVGLTECGGDCVDLLSDEQHCGSCGSACAAGYICTSGNCSLSCPVGLIEVAGTCVDPNSDEDYCGATPSNPGSSCADGQFCTDGVCTLSCPTGQAECYGLCSSLDTDEANCGACGNVCGTGEYCASGVCQTFGG